MTLTGTPVTSTSKGEGIARPRTKRPKKAWNSRVITDKWSLRLIGSVDTFRTDVAAGSLLGVAVRLEGLLGYDKTINAGATSYTLTRY